MIEFTATILIAHNDEKILLDKVVLRYAGMQQLTWVDLAQEYEISKPQDLFGMVEKITEMETVKFSEYHDLPVIDLTATIDGE